MNLIEKWAHERALLDFGPPKHPTGPKAMALECYDTLVELEDIHHQYHLAEAKILSRDAIIKQLSETQLAKDVASAEARAEKLEWALAEAMYLLYAVRNGVTPAWDTQSEGTKRLWRGRAVALGLATALETE